MQHQFVLASETTIELEILVFFNHQLTKTPNQFKQAV